MKKTRRRIVCPDCGQSVRVLPNSLVAYHTHKGQPCTGISQPVKP